MSSVRQHFVDYLTLTRNEGKMNDFRTEKYKASITIISLLVILCGTVLIGCNSLSPLTSDHNSTTEDVVEPSDVDNSSEKNINQTRMGDSLEAIDSTQLKHTPEVGEITFALGVTEDYEPIDAGFLFDEGITGIHAVFEYTGMSNQTWERVWQLNETEISRSSDVWTGPDSGVFDYFIDNGGDAMPAGDYILEIYVDGELRSLGVFIIGENSGSAKTDDTSLPASLN